MDLLFGLTQPCSSRLFGLGLTRPSSQPAQSTDEYTASEGSEFGGCTSSLHRIAVAKQILAEATCTFSPSASIQVVKNGRQLNTGALGPLMAMIKCETDSDKLKCCLETMSFMALDEANRMVVDHLDGGDLVMKVFQREKSPQTLISALDALYVLVKNDDANKERLWSHPLKHLILALAQPKLGTGQLCEVLGLLRKMAFAMAGGKPKLLVPELLPVLMNLLTPTLPHPVLLRTLGVLKMCADGADVENLHAWHLVVFRLVPLLRDNVVCGATLNVLLPLSELTSFQNMFMAAGAIPPLLALLLHPVRTVAVTATCIISCLSDVGFSRDQLCQEQALVSLLRTLQHNKEHVDVSIGVVYTLNRLACAKPSVVAALHLHNAPQLLVRLLQRWKDEDLVLAALQLLDTLGAPADAQAGVPGTGAAGLPPHALGAPPEMLTRMVEGGGFIERGTTSAPQLPSIPQTPCCLAPAEMDTSPGPGSADSANSDTTTCVPVRPTLSTASQEAVGGMLLEAAPAVEGLKGSSGVKATLQWGIVAAPRTSPLVPAAYTLTDASVIIENMA